MIDSITHKPLTIEAEEAAHPLLVVPFEQLPQVEALLKGHGVRYWVDDEALSIDGGPEITWITFSRGSDPAVLQRLLDSVP
jgi:hypothetical protein